MDNYREPTREEMRAASDAFSKACRDTLAARRKWKVVEPEGMKEEDVQRPAKKAEQVAAG